MVRTRPNPVTSFNVPIVGDVDGRSEADALRIGSDWTPGVMTVKKHGIPFTWQKQKGWGYSGAYLIFTGLDLNSFETTFEVTRQDQIDDWAVWAKKYLVKEPQQKQLNSAFLPNVPRPKALGVYHPFLAEVGITIIVPEFIGGWTAVGQPPQRWTKTIQWSQWKGPKPALGKPKAPIPDTKKVAPIALDAAQLEMRSKRQDIQARQAAIASGHR